VKMIALLPGVRARFWLDELPDLTYPLVEMMERSIAVRQSPAGDKRCAAVEFVTRAGHPSSYGLLGGSFTPQQTSRLVLQVAHSTAELDRVEWALAGRSDEVYAGIFGEDADSVLDAVEGAVAEHKLAAGVLRLDHAAHGVVGSSRSFFAKLGRIVVALLARPDALWSDDELAELLRQ